ncbi:MAG: ribokinase, partial [Clostridia bacterium]|nr:ribokinase [Clostridia bacterium]
MIFVLGSINIDMVAVVPRTVKVGETMICDKFYSGLGGKGANQAVAIAKLGGKVKFIGKVGNDENGKNAIKTLNGYGVDTEFVSVSQTVSTGIAMITVASGDNSIVAYGGANFDITTDEVDLALDGAKEGDILVMQLEMPLSVVEYGASIAKQKGMKVILNPAPATEIPQGIYSLVDLICPNETETEILTGINPRDGEAYLALAVKNFYLKGVGEVLITLGSDGSAIAQGQNITYIEPRKVKAVDTTSAGDTFIGATTLKLSQGKDLYSAVKFATVASSITVT